jgi:hypothetical protein
VHPVLMTASTLQQRRLEKEEEARAKEKIRLRLGR